MACGILTKFFCQINNIDIYLHVFRIITNCVYCVLVVDNQITAHNTM